MMTTPSVILPKSVQTRIPGKLFLTGEYAILKSGQIAILTSINQYLSCNVKENTSADLYISSDLNHLDPLLFNDITSLKNIPDRLTPGWLPAMYAIQTAIEWLNEYNYPLRPMEITIQSALQAKEGQKYGLGSSGAVIVAIILAILQFHQYPLDSHLLLFKLSVIASIRSGSNGSMADIAAISHGEWVYYQNFDHEWLKKELSSHHLMKIIKQDWPLLKIRRLTPPSDWQLLIGWTGHPASTQSLVKRLMQKTTINSETFLSFQSRISSYVHHIYQAIINEDFESFDYYIRLNHEALGQLGRNYNLPIETPILKQLVNIANQYQSPAKLSGAGGGDCGICFTSPANQKNIDSIKKTWRANHIIPLAFSVAPRIRL